MFVKLFLLCGLLATCFQYGQTNNLPKTEVKLISLMFRHGDRAPDVGELQIVPQMATNKTYQPIGLGQLTNQGKLRLYDNGVMVRKMHDKFLGDLLQDGNLVVYPTNYPRTGASALAFLAGLFPPEKEQQWTAACKQNDLLCYLSWKPELPKLWNPIPYTHNQSIIDQMTSSFAGCSALTAETGRVENLPEIQQKFSKYNTLYTYITANTGVPIVTKQLVFYITSLLIARTRVDEPLPAWAVPVWKDMLEVTELVYQMMFYTDKQRQLAGGSIAKTIIDDMLAKASGSLFPSNRKMIVYSGHDMTVAPLYAALGGTKGFVDLKGNPAPVNYPSYGSTMFVELHQIVSTGKYVVKIRYHNYKTPEPQILKLKECDELCPLEKFIQITQTTTLSRADQIVGCTSA